MIKSEKKYFTNLRAFFPRCIFLYLSNVPRLLIFKKTNKDSHLNKLKTRSTTEYEPPQRS